MGKMIPARAGQLRERVAFEVRGNVDDGMGNPQSGDFAEVYRCAARIMPKMGGETVIASRLSGTQPMLITVRVCWALRNIGTDWRLRDVRSDVVYNIKSFSNPDEKKEYLEMLAVAGVAT
jgi:head-tail adaptor